MFIIEYVTVKGKRYKLREWVTLTLMILPVIAAAVFLKYFVTFFIIMFAK